MKASGATEYQFCFLLFWCPNGIEAPGDDEIGRVDTVHAAATALTMARYTLALDRVQIEADVRLVPDLEDVLGGNVRIEPVVVGREGRREVAQVRRRSAFRR